MKKLILALLLSLLITTYAFGADVVPTRIAGGAFWDISGTIDATGDSNVMVGRLNCSSYALYIVTSGGSVNLTAAVKVGYGANYATINTYTISSATTTGIYWTFPTPRMKITYTITAGQVDDTVVYCKE